MKNGWAYPYTQGWIRKREFNYLWKINVRIQEWRLSKNCPHIKIKRNRLDFYLHEVTPLWWFRLNKRVFSDHWWLPHPTLIICCMSEDIKHYLSHEFFQHLSLFSTPFSGLEARFEQENLSVSIMYFSMLWNTKVTNDLSLLGKESTNHMSYKGKKNSSPAGHVLYVINPFIINIQPRRSHLSVCICMHLFVCIMGYSGLPLNYMTRLRLSGTRVSLTKVKKK